MIVNELDWFMKKKTKLLWNQNRSRQIGSGEI
jgi:hypothetical protein